MKNETPEKASNVHEKSSTQVSSNILVFGFFCLGLGTYKLVSKAFDPNSKNVSFSSEFLKLSFNTSNP